MSFLGKFLGGGKAYDRGVALLEEGRFSEAAEQLRLVALDGDGMPADSLASYHFRQALVLEGRRLMRGDDKSRAVPWLDEAATLWGRYPDLQCLHGAALGFAGRWEPALSAARRSLRLNPDYVEARLLEAAALQQLQRGHEAADALAALVESGRRVDHWIVAEFAALAPFDADHLPDDLMVYVGRVISGRSPKEEVAVAVALCRAGQWEEGLERFAELVLKHPRYPDYRTRHAAALFHLGRDEEALFEVDAALALNETYRLALNLKGLVLADMGRLREAGVHLSAAVAGADDSKDVLFGAYLRAVVALLTGEPERVTSLLPARTNLVREFARAELLMAAADDLGGRPSACLGRLEKLAEAWPSECVYHHLLIGHLIRAGRLKDAARQLGRWPAGGASDPRPLYLEGVLGLATGHVPSAPDQSRSAGLAEPAEPAIAAEAWSLLGARAALHKGDAAGAWATCAALYEAGWSTEPLIDLQTAAALRMSDGLASGWLPPTVVPTEGLGTRVAWLHASDRGPDAEKSAAALRRLHPELPLGWWLSLRFWLAPVRGWIA